MGKISQILVTNAALNSLHNVSLLPLLLLLLLLLAVALALELELVLRLFDYYRDRDYHCPSSSFLWLAWLVCCWPMPWNRRAERHTVKPQRCLTCNLNILNIGAVQPVPLCQIQEVNRHPAGVLAESSIAWNYIFLWSNHKLSRQRRTILVRGSEAAWPRNSVTGTSLIITRRRQEGLLPMPLQLAVRGRQSIIIMRKGTVEFFRSLRRVGLGLLPGLKD